MSKKNPGNKAAQELGRKGGKARAAKLTPEQLSEAGRKAVAARWDKRKAEQSVVKGEQSNG